MKSLKRNAILLSLTLTVAGCASLKAEPPLDLLGDVVPGAQATQVIHVDSKTKYVNVTQGDTVKFVAGEQEFAFLFSGASVVRSFDLRRVAPPSMFDRPVIAYIEPDTRYIGSDRDKD